ncbi:MAG TPA: hypothetical protein VFV38_20270 [Ktedonobacteraceae bacterium]|nr:hypothetical protein [Ktedonobacteraceae bacterium]
MNKPARPSQPTPTLDIAEETTQALPLVRHAWKKVPTVTILFWMVKLLTTALGESVSDYLVHRFDPIIAVALGGSGLALGLLLQFATRRYTAWIYWFAVAMVAVFGTMGADVVHIGFGIPYVVSSVFFAFALAAIFLVWYASEKTLSIHSISTRRRELFYWATIIATFALGTALGDMTASTWKLGYFASGILFAVLFAVPALCYVLFRLNAVFAFWFAYILTRPFGASFADWAGKPQDAGGIGLGNGKVSLVLAAIIIGCIIYLTVTRKDVEST